MYCWSFFQLSSRRTRTCRMKAPRSVSARSEEVDGAKTAMNARASARLGSFTVEAAGAGHEDPAPPVNVSARAALRELLVILLDLLPEPRRHFVGPRQRQLTVVGAELLAQIELELLQTFERRRLELCELLGIIEELIAVERAQLIDDVVQIARAGAGLAEHPT